MRFLGKSRIPVLIFCLAILLWFFLGQVSGPRIRIDPPDLSFFSPPFELAPPKPPTGEESPLKNLSHGGHYCGIAPSPDFFSFSQPNGVSFEGRIVGTSHHNWVETRKGKPARRNPSTGYYEYLIPSLEGKSLLSGKRVALDPPPEAPLSMGIFSERETTSPKQDSPLSSRQEVTRTTKEVRQLVILANFSDTTPTYSQEDFQQLFNGENYSLYGARGSVKQYYREVSYGQMDLKSTVSPWVTLPQTRAYYGANSGSIEDLWAREMILHALEALEAQGFDFSTFDADGDGWMDCFAVIHQGRGEEAGGGEEAIWSHKWALERPITKGGVNIQTYYTGPECYNTQITTIGVLCHEIAHFFGLPDLYDTDGSSAAIGRWGLMATGCWNLGGKSPSHFCGWSKMALGWVNPTVVPYSQPNLSLLEGSKNGQSYLIPTPLSQEYFLIENRSLQGFDEGLPSAGMLIWHIDDNQRGNDHEGFYQVALEQADGLFHLEKNLNSGDGGDPWPGEKNSLLFDETSLPNSHSNSGKATGISLSAISPAGETMTFSLAILGEKMEKLFRIYNDGATSLVVYSLAQEKNIFALQISQKGSFSISPGGSIPITVSINTGDFQEGLYEENLLLSSNDPVNPLLKMKVTVHLAKNSTATDQPSPSSRGGGGCSLNPSSSGAPTFANIAGVVFPVMLFVFFLWARKFVKPGNP